MFLLKFRTTSSGVTGALFRRTGYMNGSVLPRNKLHCEGIYSFVDSGVTCVTPSRFRTVYSLRWPTANRLFKKYTQIDISYIDTHEHKFRHLIAESRLEIAFTGRPRGFNVSSYKIYRYEHSEGLAVVFGV